MSYLCSYCAWGKSFISVSDDIKGCWPIFDNKKFFPKISQIRIEHEEHKETQERMDGRHW